MSRLASWLLIPLALGVGACASSSNSPAPPEAANPRSAELRVLVDNQGIRLVDGAEAMGTPRTVAGGQPLRYEFRAEDRRLLKAGHVPDPRTLRSEWVAGDTYEQRDVSAMSGIANVTPAERRERWLRGHCPRREGVGDVLSRCENNELSTWNCAEGRETCGWSEQAGYYDCL